MAPDTRRKLAGRKRHFLKETCIRDIKQGQEIGLDLLESIMRPTDPVKEELRRISFKMIHFRFKTADFDV